MFNFPEHLYTDVRIEDVFETAIVLINGDLQDNKVRQYKGAFIRIFDGQRWYYSATSEVNNIQNEIDALASLAKKNKDIYEHAIVKKLEVNKGEHYIFNEESVREISHEKKEALAYKLLPMIKEVSEVKIHRVRYVDTNKIKYFYSSKGANLSFDYQSTGVAVSLTLAEGDKNYNCFFQVPVNYFEDIKGLEELLKEKVEEGLFFLKNSKPVIPGDYTVIFSPHVAGVFAHESFGHKSEADFMIGDEAMKKAWAIGSKVGVDNLSIVDDGNIVASGYAPFDDEGNKGKKTYLIKDGILQERLHSTVTAEALSEEITGNARAIDFKFEPIVRMTNTYIEAGKMTLEEMIKDIKEGILVKDMTHGSGMSTFTIAPNLSYMIRDGKIAEPVSISVISGDVMKTLYEIDGLTDGLSIISSITGGCGKGEQMPLPVGTGGPYVRIKKIKVQ